MIPPQCAKCKPKYCHQGTTDDNLLPSFCPIINYKELIQETKKQYQSKEIQQFYTCAALIEKEAYDETAAREEGKMVPVRPRIKEIAEFAKKIDAKKIGIAFCSGLADEAARASAILEKHGLDVSSAVCCCGAVDKTEVGLNAEHKIRDPHKFESACNPLLQASLLNKTGTDINVLVGLCVGHAMLFTTDSNAPVTTLIVKDRLTGHNPVISLYTRYHKDIV
jgi:uncharacterized metal-binding protein